MAPSTTPARRALVIAIAALVFAALLNADEIERTARRQPLGWRRDALVHVTSAIRRVADGTRLTTFRHGIEDATGREPQTQATPGDTKTTPGPAVSPSRRAPTRADPLRMWIGGDSVMQVLGESIVTMSDSSGFVSPKLEFHISTGLARPDYFDWPARLATVVAGEDPEAVVVMFGAHDVQGMETPAGPAAFGSSAWTAEYRARVERVMTLLSGSVATVYWVGQPAMRSDSFGQRIATLNSIYRSAAERYENVRFVDTWTATVDGNGHYTAYLPDGRGNPVLARAPDGVHLERAGGDRLARLVLDTVGKDWGLPLGD